MKIHSEAKTIASSIIEWCFSNEDNMKEDVNYPSHIVENLLKRQKKELIEKCCSWLEKNARFDKVDGEWIFNTEDFRKAMEEL